MSKVKYTRINLFNDLVCPTEITSGEWSFDEWCTTLKDQEQYLAQRSYLLLDFYSAFRKVYNFFIASDVDETNIRKLYCNFSDDNTEMIIVVKYKNPRDIDPSYFESIATFFDVDPGDTYDDFDVEPPCESHNSLKLYFRKKG